VAWPEEEVAFCVCVCVCMCSDVGHVGGLESKDCVMPEDICSDSMVSR
jgi:hypothetical protein